MLPDSKVLVFFLVEVIGRGMKKASNLEHHSVWHQGDRTVLVIFYLLHPTTLPTNIPKTQNGCYVLLLIIPFHPMTNPCVYIYIYYIYIYTHTYIYNHMCIYIYTINNYINMNRSRISPTSPYNIRYIWESDSFVLRTAPHRSGLRQRHHPGAGASVV